MTTKTAFQETKIHQWPPQGEWTYEHYKRLPDDGRRYEVIAGELFMSPAPRPTHQRVSLKLAVALHQFVKRNNLGAVYAAPVDLILLEMAAPVQPDLLFINHNNLEIVKENFIEGIPDLVIEVLSPGTADYDRRTKYNLYASAGIPEYWIVDPDGCVIEVFALRGNAYVPLGSFGRGSELQSELLPDLRIVLDEICAAS